MPKGCDHFIQQCPAVRLAGHCISLNLLYLVTRTRPQIVFAVCTEAIFCERPTKQHWVAIKLILRYLNGSQSLGILYSKGKVYEYIGYSDADWTEDLKDRESASGYVLMTCGAAISWKSKYQTCVALSTAEGEEVAVASAIQEAIWIQRLLFNWKETSNESTIIYEDKQSAICLA